MDIYVSKNQAKSFTKDNWPNDKITSLVVEEDAVLSFVNNSDEVKLLEMDEGILLSVAGEMYITGQMIELAKFNSEPIDLPIPGYNIPIVWVETNEGSNEFEMFRCVNIGALDYKFEDFAPLKGVGNVFRIENNKIVFSSKESQAIIPKQNARIMIPNVLISVENGKTAASFTENAGGLISLRNVLTDNLKMNLSGFQTVKLNHVGSTQTIYLEYNTNTEANNIGVANNSHYASGLVTAYCSNINLSEVLAQSVSNNAIVVQYMDKPVLNDLQGIVLDRSYNTTASVLLSSINNTSVNNVEAIGAFLKIENASKIEVKNIVCVDDKKLNTNTIHGQSNISVEDSAYVSIYNVEIPKNGIALTSPIEVVNSNNIKVININGPEGASRAIVAQVVFNSVFARIDLGEVNYPKEAISIDNRSRNNVFQNINIDNVKTLKIGGINTLLKDVSAENIELLPGAYDTYFALLRSATSKVVFKMMPNSNSKALKGEPGFYYDGGLKIAQNDIIEIEAKTMIKGIQFTDNPVIQTNNSKIRVFFKLITSNYESDYMLLNKDNLLAQNPHIENEYVKLVLRIDGSQLEDNKGALIDSITIPVDAKQSLYPVSFKKLYIHFNPQAQYDPTAVFALMYANTYKQGKGIFLKDKDGKPIVGKVNGKDSLVFEYDFDEDNTANREPGKDFDVVGVLTTSSLVEPVEIVQTMTKDDVFAISFNPGIDKAYEVAKSLLKDE